MTNQCHDVTIPVASLPQNVRSVKTQVGKMRNTVASQLGTIVVKSVTRIGTGKMTTQTESPEQFRAWLADRLEEYGYSQGEASEKAGLSRGYVSKILNGQPAGLEACLALANLFQTPPTTVLWMAGHIDEPLTNLPPEIEAIAVQIASIPDERRRRSVMRIVAAALETALDDVENGDGAS
jgi:transcriptional regulator with XRE-family HTH domain